MALLRRSALSLTHPKLHYTSVDLSAFLVQRETINGHGKHLFIEQISPGGIIYNGGIRHSDRLISVNKVPVEQFSFDLILESIRSLSVIALAVERKVNGKVVPIVVILDIGFKSDGNPYLEFGGFYWNSDYADIERFIPVEVRSLNTYQYSGKQENVRFVVTEGTEQLWLEVDGDDIEFTESNGSLTSFTMYKYDPTRSPTNSQVVILVPTDQPCFCLAAKKDNDLVLWPFDETVYTGDKPIPDNASFLELVPQDDSEYKIESTVNNGWYITNDDMKAVMTTTGSLFKIESGA
ncbi:hypothetical protein BSL78_04799 [Apostichopus japonicus]|uniref:PDZ domain-containing protein n=1 Tax=Stichopus japonicus TaxID=307972 RepID=A0A2G8LDH7_STIJA|nr:hypothetical protein BSL78_04799 [Apostichopus japonicus]